MSKKKLQINCEMCDVRGVTREVLDAYESVKINAEILFHHAESMALLADYNVSINAENMISLPDGQNAANKSFNGKCHITKGMFQTPTYLVVNGCVDIDEDAFDGENHLLGITVNGVISYPDSLSGALPPMTVNGKSIIYPGGSVKLPASAVIDKLFALRAKAGKYYAEKRVVAVDRSADIARMVEKKIRFITKKAYIASSLLEDGLSLFDETVDIAEVEDGTVYLPECDAITSSVLRRCGGKLLTFGNVKLMGLHADELQQLERLYVYGTVFADMAAEERLSELALPAQTSVVPVRGDLIADRGELRISAAQLDRCDALTLSCCGTVEFDKDISAETIREKVALYDCGMVTCTPEQHTAVEGAAVACGCISSAEDGLCGKAEEDSTVPETDNRQDTIYINANEYRF